MLPVTRYFLNPFREESDESSMFINVHLVRRDNRIGTWKRSFRTFMYNTQACLKIQLFQNPTGATFGENENKNSNIIYTLKKKKKKKFKFINLIIYFRDLQRYKRGWVFVRPYLEVPIIFWSSAYLLILATLRDLWDWCQSPGLGYMKILPLQWYTFFSVIFWMVG